MRLAGRDRWDIGSALGERRDGIGGRIGSREVELKLFGNAFSLDAVTATDDEVNLRGQIVGRLPEDGAGISLETPAGIIALADDAGTAEANIIVGNDDRAGVIFVEIKLKGRFWLSPVSTYGTDLRL